MGADMTSIQVLHVDDEPDIRDVVEMSLGLDPAFALRSCASGKDALAATAAWSPDLILLDVMMPDMDGPTTLLRLREQPQTATVPVVFMTARVAANELYRFLSLGVAGVIAKPFDPMTLAAQVLGYAPGAEIRMGADRSDFLLRARADARMLTMLRHAMGNDQGSSAALHRIAAIAHGLADDAGLRGFPRIGTDAGALEDAAASTAPGEALTDVQRTLDELIVGIEREAVPTRFELN
jgi:two-component system OmpR family response regulator